MFVALLLPEKNLPRDNAEFYQVCYVDEKKRIKGVSSSFQLCDEESSGSLGQVAAVDQTDGVVLVTSDLTSLHANNSMVRLMCRIATIRHGTSNALISVDFGGTIDILCLLYSNLSNKKKKRH